MFAPLSRSIFLSFALLSGWIENLPAAAVWPWSVPVPSIEGRRAYLWVPPQCQRVRGLVVACQNMLEQPLFERPAFRSACAENDLGLVLIFSGHDKGNDDDKNPNHPRRSSLDVFLNPAYPKGHEDPQGAGKDLQKALSDLADESGYGEIKYAPLVPVGHSSAGSFVWHLYRWDPSRIFAVLPFKTGAKDDGPTGIPIFDINSEWFEYGTNEMHNVGFISLDGGAGVSRSRTHSPDSLYSYYVDLGSGHCDVSDDCIQIVRLFLKKAVAARIPADAPLDAPVKLKEVATNSGWLIDPAALGKPEGKPVPYTDYRGDANQAFWYLDHELAITVQDHLVAQLSKKPLQIGFIKDGKPSTDARMFILSPALLDDAGTFKIQATYVDQIDHCHFGDKGNPYYPAETKLSTDGPPIQYRVNSGGVIQTGADTFRVCPRDGPLTPQGNPWEPTLVAYSPGDAQHRPTEHPAHLNISIVNKEGNPQTLTFANIPDAISTRLSPVHLQASTTAGLPVEFLSPRAQPQSMAIHSASTKSQSAPNSPFGFACPLSSGEDLTAIKFSRSAP